jgi:hypothetical protein
MYELLYIKFSMDQMCSNYGHITLICPLMSQWHESHNNHLVTVKVKVKKIIPTPFSMETVLLDRYNGNCTCVTNCIRVNKGCFPTIISCIATPTAHQSTSCPYHNHWWICIHNRKIKNWLILNLCVYNNNFIKDKKTHLTSQ